MSWLAEIRLHLRHLSFLSCLPPLGLAQLSPGQALGGLHPHHPCFLHTQRTLFPGQLVTHCPSLGGTIASWEGQGCVSWRRSRKRCQHCTDPNVQPWTCSPYPRNPSGTHVEGLCFLQGNFLYRNCLPNAQSYSQKPCFCCISLFLIPIIG